MCRYIYICIYKYVYIYKYIYNTPQPSFNSHSQLQNAHAYSNSPFSLALTHTYLSLAS